MIWFLILQQWINKSPDEEAISKETTYSKEQQFEQEMNIAGKHMYNILVKTISSGVMHMWFQS